MTTKNNTPTIHMNSFVQRQTPESRFSHFTGTEAELLQRVRNGWANRMQGYRNGVTLVRVPAEGFYTSVVRLNEGDTLAGVYEPRRPGELPRKALFAKYNITNGNDSNTAKMPAEQVDVVLYSSSVLAEDNDNELNPEPNNWEVISINASPEQGEVPINPEALMHNHFGSDGGTATNLSNDEFVQLLRESFTYWQDKALIS